MKPHQSPTPIVIINQHNQHIIATLDGIENPNANIALLHVHPAYPGSLVPDNNGMMADFIKITISDTTYEIKHISWTNPSNGQIFSHPIIEIELK